MRQPHIFLNFIFFFIYYKSAILARQHSDPYKNHSKCLSNARLPGFDRIFLQEYTY